MPDNTHSAIKLTQPGGMFAVPGLENAVLSTHVTPQGLGSLLPSMPSNVDDPRYPVLTGWEADSGNEANEPCDTAPRTFMKAGTLTAQFGRIARMTNTIEIDAVLHRQRGATNNLRLLGSMLGTDTMASGEFPENPLDLVIAAEMVGVGVSMERTLAKLLWRGNPANNTAGGGYKEFPGLDAQITTGHVDAETNVPLPSVDSQILDFNYNDVDGTTLDIVEYISALEYYMTRLAEQTRVGPVQWVFVMRPELWHLLSAVWPCRYYTNRCTDVSGSNPVVINDDANVRLRDQMRSGRFIEVNGNRYNVVLDDGILEQNNAIDSSVPAGKFASTIYMVPLTIMGRMPVTYWEYVDYRQVRSELVPMGDGARIAPFWTDGGRFLWAATYNKYCFDMIAKVEPRVVLLTPHLAGKIQNVVYSTLLHTRDFDPGSPYWVNGGVSTRSVTSGYAVWK